MFWSFLHVHPPQSHANGARRDNDDSVAVIPKSYGILDNQGKDGQKRLMSDLVDYGACAWE